MRLNRELLHKRAALVEFLEGAQSKVSQAELHSTLKLNVKCKLAWPSSNLHAIQFFDIIAEKIKSFKRDRKNWSKVELGLLFFLLLKLVTEEAVDVLELNEDQWARVGGMFPGRTGEKCMFKWLTFRKFELSSYPWTEAEDAVLESLVKRQ